MGMIEDFEAWADSLALKFDPAWERHLKADCFLAWSAAWQAAAKAEREACAKLIASDADAISYQSMGQYRTAMVKAIRSREG